MRLTELEIQGVRNLSNVAIECVRGLNLFVGANGAGKTAILESIYLLARGRSFRAGSIGAVIERGAPELVICTEIQDERRGAMRVRLSKGRAGVAELLINGEPQRALSSVAGLMPIQVMLPDASNLVLGPPDERRRFLDWGTFHVEPGYVKASRDFQRALQQRNAVLRETPRRRSSDELDVWTARVVELGVTVDEMRRRYVASLLPAVARWMSSMIPNLQLRVVYYAGWPEHETLDESLRETHARDVNSAVTSRGPHRAELRLEVGTERASAVLSRGQAKMVASAMRLAQAEVTSQLGGRRCIFLIDDIGAELDDTHNERFFGALETLECQVFATATDAQQMVGWFAGERVKVFHVEQGKLACWQHREA